MGKQAVNCGGAGSEFCGKKVDWEKGPVHLMSFFCG